MQLGRWSIPLIVGLVALTIASGCDSKRSHQTYTVAVVGGGDTALDGEFLDEIVRTIDKSSMFAVISGATAADLVVKLERNVRPLEIGPNGLVAFEATIRSATGESIDVLGQCPKQQLNLCANHILEQAQELTSVISKG